MPSLQGGKMWQLHMTNEAKEWGLVGDFETIGKPCYGSKNLRVYPTTVSFSEHTSILSVATTKPYAISNTRARSLLMSSGANAGRIER